MYNVHLTHSLLCFEFVEFTLYYFSPLSEEKGQVSSEDFTKKNRKSCIIQDFIILLQPIYINNIKSNTISYLQTIY